MAQLSAALMLVWGFATTTPTQAAPPLAQGMRPAAGAQSHLATESSQVLPAWAPTATLLTVYGGDRGVAENAGAWRVENRTSAHLLTAIGLFDHAEIGFDLPLVMYQTGSAASDRTSLEPAAFGDLRTTLKGTIFRTPLRGFGLGAALDFTAPTGNTDALTSAGGVTVAPQVLAEYRATRGIQAAVNIGYLVRPDSRVGDYTLGDALTYRIAGKVPFGPQGQLQAIAELDGSIGVVDGADHPMSLRAGIRWRMRSGILVGIFGGGAPVSTLGTPDGHAMLSLGYAPPNLIGKERAFAGSPRPTPVMLARRHERSVKIARQKKSSANDKSAPANPQDPDSDGVLVVADACPNVPEDLDGHEDSDGCPELDNDRDGIRDGLDLCRDAPEVNNGYADWDGCPDRIVAGVGETFEQFDFATVAPTLAFSGDDETLDDASHQSLARFAELLRLNPWMSQIDLSVYAEQGQGKPENAADALIPEQRQAAELRLAERRAKYVVDTLDALGVDSWRVRVTPARHRVPGKGPQIVLALRGKTAGLRPIAPTPARVDELIADGTRTARAEAEALRRELASRTRALTGQSGNQPIEVMAQGGRSSDSRNAGKSKKSTKASPKRSRPRNGPGKSRGVPLPP